jgi:hypothetical protein
MSAWLTQKDVDDYGHDVLDLAHRAALHAMTPELQRIDHQNAELRQQLAALSDARCAAAKLERD